MTTTTGSSVDLTNCDREPIHIPGSIQPHGVLLVADSADFVIRQRAGDTARLLGVEPNACLGRSVAEVLGAAADRLVRHTGEGQSKTGYLGTLTLGNGVILDLLAHHQDGQVLLELEPAPADAGSAADHLAATEEAIQTFKRAPTLDDLYARAAREMRRLTGFDRVMVYRFLDDGAGRVIAEDRAAHLPSFLNHHYPASDIPQQARALYLRNVIRVIPDAGYQPRPVEPVLSPVTGESLDMSDCVLRSVSPIHAQYLRNMGVVASMSVSLIKENTLWGLIACHHETPRQVPFAQRAICRVLASALSQHIGDKEDTEFYRQRARLREAEDKFLRSLTMEGPVKSAASLHREELRDIVASDGVAVCLGDDIATSGTCPPPEQIRALLRWLPERTEEDVFATDRLSTEYPEAGAFAERASGLLAGFIARDEAFAIMWFRAEQVEVVNWAGNPNKAAEPGSEPGTLTPRMSFDIWAETVRGRSLQWTRAEIETAGRIGTAVQELRRGHRIRMLNSQLRTTLADKESLLMQKDYLLREVNHRVQNSIQLVSSLVAIQRQGITDPTIQGQLDALRQRLMAVALVHRRLYQSDQVQTIELDRYLQELRDEFIQFVGPEWERHIRVDGIPVTVPTDRGINLALVIVELLTNAVKYAYDGGTGPVLISLQEAEPRQMRVIVADNGRGLEGAQREGFGSRLILGLIKYAKGSVEFSDNRPGTRAVITVPLA